MKVTMRLGLLVLFAFFVVGCTGGKMGVLNPDLAYQNSTASEKGTAYLKEIGAELEKELRAGEEKVNNAKTKKEKAAAQAEMQQKLMNIQQRFNAEQQQVLSAISDVYKKAVDSCREKLGLDLVLPSEAVLSHNPAMDITSKVTEEMNAIPFELKPLQPDEKLSKAGQ